MKNILRKLTFILFCSVIVSLASCNDDYPNDGYLKVDDKSYTINDAVLTSVGYDDGYYQLRLTLDNTNANDAHSLNVLIYSQVKDYLPSAKYTPYLYDDNYHNKFKRAAWLVGNVEAGVIMEGSIKSTKNNDIYTIHADFVDTDGRKVIGEYKGEIKVLY